MSSWDKTYEKYEKMCEREGKEPLSKSKVYKLLYKKHLDLYEIVEDHT